MVRVKAPPSLGCVCGGSRGLLGALPRHQRCLLPAQHVGRASHEVAWSQQICLFYPRLSRAPDTSQKGLKCLPVEIYFTCHGLYLTTIFLLHEHQPSWKLRGDTRLRVYRTENLHICIKACRTRQLPVSPHRQNLKPKSQSEIQAIGRCLQLDQRKRLHDRLGTISAKFHTDQTHGCPNINDY